MGKQESPKEAPKEEKKPGGEGNGAPKGGPGGGHAPAPNKHVQAKVGCLHLGCKAKDVRFSFCEEHFRQFKFGLITKTGEKVMDYDKKFEHYQKWLKAQAVQKVG